MAEENHLLSALNGNMKDIKEKVTEISKEVKDLRSQSDRTSSHLESELGNINRQFNDIRDKTGKILNVIYGEGHADSGLLVRLDRLEQAEKRREGQVRLIWSILGTVIAAILIYLITSYALPNNSATPPKKSVDSELIG